MHTITATVKIYHTSPSVTAVGLGILKPDGDFEIVKAVAFGKVAEALSALPEGKVISAEVDFTSSRRTIKLQKEREVVQGKGKNKKTVLEPYVEEQQVDMPGFKIIRFNALMVESQVIETEGGKSVRVPRIPSEPITCVGRLGNAGRYNEKADKTFGRLVINQTYQDRDGKLVEKSVWLNVVLPGEVRLPEKAQVRVTAQPHLYDGAIELHASSLIPLESRRAA